MDIIKTDYTNYDEELMKSLVGKTISLYGTEWKVVDYLYHYLYLEGEGGGHMEHCTTVQHKLETQAAHDKMVETEAFQKLFDQRGCYREGWFMASDHSGYNVAVGGHIGGFASSIGGVTIDHRTVVLRNYDDVILFGGQSAGYGMAHTFREDTTKPCGYYMKASDREIEIDKLPWKSIEAAKDEAAEELSKMLTLIGFDIHSKDYNKPVLLASNIKGGSMVFYDPEHKVGYKLSAPMTLDWGGSYYSLTKGTIKGNKLVHKSNRTKWSIPKVTHELTWNEVREIILNFQRYTLDDAFKLTARQKLALSSKK